MAKFVYTNCSVVVNSVDLSDHVESVELSPKTGKGNAAAMGDVEDYSLPTTRDVGDIKINFYQDFATAKTYQTMFSLWQNRTTFNLVVKTDAGANAVTNPAFTIPVFISQQPIISGKRGDVAMAPVVFTPAGVMTVATS